MKKPRKTKPGEFEMRIRPDGRIFVSAADEAMMDVIEALDPLNPAVQARRKAKNRGRKPKPAADDAKADDQGRST